MSYLTHEQSVHDSEPVELYKFEGSYASFYYTSGPEEVVYGGHTYEPITIERSEINTGTQEDDGLDITVTLSVLTPLVIAYAFTISPPKLTLTIYRQQPDETVVYWIGPVTNISTDNKGQASLQCPSVLGAALNGNVPNVYYQTPCNNVLYDERCKVNEADWTVNGTVTAISADGRTITVSTIGTLDGKLFGGELGIASGERRMIVEQTGTAIVVNFPFSAIAVGQACHIAAGCDYAYSGDCKHKFNNQVNFTGFQFIPPINPFSAGIEPAAVGVTDDACLFVHDLGYWGEVRLEFTHGMITPHQFPGVNWYISNLSGGSMLTADNYWDYEGGPSDAAPCTAMNGFYFKPETAGPRGESGYPVDPFAGGTPTFNMTIQFSVTAFTGGGGKGRAYFRRPNEDFVPLICVESGTYDFDIGNLWPATYNFILGV